MSDKLKQMVRLQKFSKVQMEGYRQDIDGVRAIAVLSVLCFPSVDARRLYWRWHFFVFAGYLISPIQAKPVAQILS